MGIQTENYPYSVIISKEAVQYIYSKNFFMVVVVCSITLENAGNPTYYGDN
jgi:hypothetical protein